MMMMMMMVMRMRMLVVGPGSAPGLGLGFVHLLAFLPALVHVTQIGLVPELAL